MNYKLIALEVMTMIELMHLSKSYHTGDEEVSFKRYQSFL